jgi:hypothetical protein
VGTGNVCRVGYRGIGCLVEGGLPTGRASKARMAKRVELLAITDEVGDRLLPLVRRSSGSVVTWRRAHIVQGISAVGTSELVFTDANAVREVIHNVRRDGFEAL